jgi:hypothetical protein
MIKGDWQNYAAALRKEREELQRVVDDNPQALGAAAPAVVLLGALENAARRMAGDLQ